ncbi:uncharacterized protein LOC127129736 [Lathyrus oleraceus]|uniref:uncharacterized protein LOC127129736 n=1 Tax=Pisum sativum TaxID=3888 RepID=UPI0021D39746|nr:uncharacterized protein LOC127129736 [Pisum sativum]
MISHTTFKGRYDPDGARTWLREIERIFRVMDCSEAQKVQFDMHMLTDDWEFMRKYFPEDVRGKKKIEFLEMKQGTCRLLSMLPDLWNLLSSTLIRIRRFLEFANNCRIYEDDSKAQSAHYKALSERRGKQNLNHGKPYSALTDKGKHRVIDSKRPKWGRCGKSGHMVADCKKNIVTCYNYGKPRHINTHCLKPNTTHSFIVVDCVKRLSLVVYSMSGEMVIETPAKGSVTTTLVCLNCHMLIFDKYFSVDLIYFPLENLDVILGMNRLESNHVYINCYNKSVWFLTPGEEEEVSFLSTKELHYENSFIELKKRLTTTSVLILPESNESFVVYCDTSLMGLGGVLMQDGKVVAYASR